MKVIIALFAMLLVGCASNQPTFESAPVNAQTINLYLFEKAQDTNAGIQNYYQDPQLMNTIAKNNTPVALQNTFSGDMAASAGGAIGGAIVGALIEAEMRAIEAYRDTLGLHADNPQLEAYFEQGFSSQRPSNWKNVNTSFSDGALQLYPNHNANEMNVSVSWNHYINPIDNLFQSGLQIVYEFDVISVDPEDNSLDTLKYYVDFGYTEAGGLEESEEQLLANDKALYNKVSEIAFKSAAKFIYHQLDNIKEETHIELASPEQTNGFTMHHHYITSAVATSTVRF
ncbi:hypothetical protein [Vibrio coralliilyticus]|uniref:hypothetical protein n=1 Tax=Vibrio coralliilyticus TaxID=190893 RepID=UPI00148C37ED|nr:hypothetical protein [Vibrio coralliilyticus]NOI30526.1 hypothetical protein [Vibrio coralliilyticus]NOI50114.1 hypothetical protein [Vibrio coralliilyticus]